MEYRLYFFDFDMGFIGFVLFMFMEEGILVIWIDEGEVGMNLVDCYFVFMIDGLIGFDFEMGLENLKMVIEN